MKTISIALAFTAFLLFFGLNQAKAQKQNLSDKVDSVFADYNRPGVPGASVLVSKDGEIILEKAYGLARLEPEKKTTPNTCYRLASISKQFTAMSILMLYEQEKLSLSTTLKDVFPDFPDYGKKITIDHLVHHTSGLIDYEELLPDEDRETVGLDNRPDSIQLKDKDILDLMMTIDSTYFEPGTDYRYSNTGYALLAMIIEKTSGLSFAEFLDKNIFEPLGMKNSVAYERGVSQVSHRAYGCHKTDSGYVEADQSYTSAVLGDGGVYTSIREYNKWNQALYSDKLVNEKRMDLAFMPGQLADGRWLPTGYGFGWYIYREKGRKYLLHRGTTYGFSNMVIRLLDEKLTVMVLTNRNENIKEVENLLFTVANLYTGNLYKPSIAEPLWKMILEKGIDPAVQQYQQLKQEASEHFFFHPNCIVNLGYKMKLLQRNNDALKLFKLATQEFPQSESAFFALGEMYFQSGEDDKSKIAFESVLKINPDNSAAKNMLKKLAH